MSLVRLRKNILKQPTVSRSEYTVRNIERAFPSGEWVEEPAGGPSPAREGLDSPPALTVIGGTKYDEAALGLFFGHFFASYDPQVEIITGAGKGVEASIEATTRIPNDPHLGRKVNVEQVLCVDLDSPVLIVGSGERVKQAKSWLARTMSKREVIELP